MSGDTASHPFAVSKSAEAEARFSPDSKWVAYSSTETGRRQVFVRPFPTGDVRVQVSVDGGEQPVWSPDGHSLYYSDGLGSMLVRAGIALTQTFVVTSRDTVLRGGFDIVPGNGHATYDVAADGTLLLVRRLSSTTPPVLAIGWFDQVRAAVAK